VRNTASILASDNRSVEVSETLSENDESNSEWGLWRFDQFRDAGGSLAVSASLHDRHDARAYRQQHVVAEGCQQRREGPEWRRHRRIEIRPALADGVDVKDEPEDKPATHVERTEQRQ